MWRFTPLESLCEKHSADYNGINTHTQEKIIVKAACVSVSVCERLRNSVSELKEENTKSVKKVSQ